jgi:hypothetical protein
MAKENRNAFPAMAQHSWRTAQAVCFDVDSTVTVGEGIDELADFCGVGEVVAQWYLISERNEI